MYIPPGYARFRTVDELTATFVLRGVSRCDKSRQRLAAIAWLQPQHAMNRGKLIGWKAIGRALDCDARTAQRWEQARGLPVHRVPGEGSATVYAFADEIAAWLQGSRTPDGSIEARGAEDAPGLLVLPLEYCAADPSLAFVADGLAQDLIGRLAATHLWSMRVLSWATSRAYRSTTKRARQLAQELAIRYFVEGTVSDAGDRWRVDVRVVDAVADRVVLSDRFTAPGRDVLLLQAHVADAVAAHLSLHLAGEETDSMWTRPVDPRAFLSFLDGVAQLAQGGGDSATRAIASFDEALRVDREFLPALAQRGIALLHVDHQTGWLRDDVQREVRDISLRCADETPDLVSGVMLDGLVGRYECAWDRIDRRLERSLARNPAAVGLRHLYAGNLTLRREFDRAAEVIAPLDGLDRSVESERQMAAASLWRRDFDAAIARFDAILAREPSHVYANAMRFMAAIYRRDRAFAARCYRDMDAAVRDTYGPFLRGCLSAIDGDGAAARASRAEVATRAAASRLGWYHVAMIDGLLGDSAGATENLARSFARREATCSLGAVDPSFDAVRASRPFQDLVRSMGLPA
jgi:TolB-like protein